MSYNRFLSLLLKKKSGKLSTGEQQELNTFLRNNPDYYELSGVIDELYEVPLKEIKEVDKTYLKQRWDALKEKTTGMPGGAAIINLNKRTNRYTYYIAAASIIGLLLVGGFYFFKRGKYDAAKDMVVATQMGSKTSMKLPDGSTVWLNAGSQISYNKEFGKKLREVTLTGEAYFDVVSDASHPFIVHTNDFNVKVLGTIFNIKAYASDDESEAALVKGSIELTLNKGDARKILLKPNEKLIFKKADFVEKSKPQQHSDRAPEIKISSLEVPFKDSIAIETQWTHDCLAFRNYKLRDIASLIERRYGVSVEITDDNLKEKEFSGLFKDETVEQVIHALQMAGGFKYTIDKNKITIAL